MEENQQIKNKLIKQTVGGQSVLTRFFEEILEEQPEAIRNIELTYFALSVSTIFYLQFGEQNNKKALLDEVITAVLRRKISETNGNFDIKKAHQEFEDRLSTYSTLITNLLKDKGNQNPIVELLITFYESVTQHSAADKAFRTGKAGRVLSKYIIDNIKFAQKEFRTSSTN